MSSYEVSEPILNSPFERPGRYWYIQEGEQPQLREGRRPPVIFPPRDQKEEWTETALLRRSREYPAGYELVLVSLIRERIEAWRGQGHLGVTRTTLELPPVHLILETKGFDEREEVKRAAADRWFAAVNADGTYGKWAYALAKKPAEVPQLIDAAVNQAV
jgi:hypothetical protein